jgi:hypothetical protein
MKKLLSIGVFLSVILVAFGCFAGGFKTKIKKPGSYVETLDPKLARDAMRRDPSNGLDPACAEMVRQGKASYVRTDAGVQCYVYSQPGTGPTMSGGDQHGGFENWLPNTAPRTANSISENAVNVTIRDRSGFISRSFTVLPMSFYKLDLPPGEYIWQAQKVSGGDWITSTLTINVVRGDNFSQLGHGQYDWVARIVPN